MDNMKRHPNRVKNTSFFSMPRRNYLKFSAF